MEHAAEIRIAGNLLEIRGVGLDVLEDELCYDHRTYHPQWDAEKRVTVERRCLFDESPKGHIVVPAGLLRRVCARLDQIRIPYHIEDLRPEANKLPPCDWSRIAHYDFRSRQDELLATMSVEDRGVIEAPTGYGKGFIAMCVCRMYPTVPIIIASPRVPIVRETYRRILDGENDVGMVGGGKNELDKRVTVCTSKSLMKTELSKCRIFMYDECHTAAAPQTSETISAIRHARMFGFSASPEGRSDGAELRTEALFGPIIFRMGYEEAKDAGAVVPITVMVYDIDGGMLNYQSPIARKRWGIWRNRTRNETIARAALQFEDAQVLIMVETLEHAIFLKSLLPHYELVYSASDRKRIDQILRSGNLDFDVPSLGYRARQELADRFKRRELKHVIATGVWSQGVDFPDLQVLVRADGASGRIPSIQLPGRVSRVADGKEFGIVIDFMDRFDERFRRRSNQRISHYRKQGWDIRLEKAWMRE